MRRFAARIAGNSAADIVQLSQPGDLGIGNANCSLVQRIVDPDAGADLQRRQLQAAGSYRPSPPSPARY